MSNLDLVIKLLLQLTVILLTCRVVTMFGKRFLGQTDVVCEMIAGVTLGPSLFGAIAPSVQQWLFPKAALFTAAVANSPATVKIPNPSMSLLFAVSQIGLVIYMFLIGLEFNTDFVKSRFKHASFVALAGMVAPFILGATAALLLMKTGESLFLPEIKPPEAALYLGAAMSVTAFPMLARILYERGITKTSFGTLALAAGSMDDGAVWCLLAIVLTSTKSDPTIAALAIGGGVAYAIFTLTVGKRMLKVFSRIVKRDRTLTVQTLTLVLAVLTFCAWLTDAIQLYAVFGAFLLGTAMPRGEFAEQVRSRTEYLTTGFLLPMFFVFSGLNTEIGLVNTPTLWAITLFIIALAIAGKAISCTIAAKLSGENWRESLIVGALMNARGLMGLIILNVGLEQKIITPTLFTMMVIMAIVTTLMASPIVNYLLQGTAYDVPQGNNAALE
jgi:Kef-type K+ transport system membrane component KefB